MSIHKYQAVSEVLKAAQVQVNALLSDPEDELHRIQINNVLQLQADRILLITGAGDITNPQSTVLGPAKTIGGQPIGKVRKFTEEDLKPSDDAVFNLKKQVEAALSYFGPNANSEGILANIPEVIVRGVAKKAGLPFSKEYQKEITVEFIDQIKAALHPEGGDASIGKESENVAPLIEGEGGIPVTDTVVEKPEETAPTETAAPVAEPTDVVEPAPGGSAPAAAQQQPEQPKAEKKTKTGK
jgi:hypothetical protein